MKEYETSDFGGKGRKTDQKLKPFLVLQYLMKCQDDEHVVSASDLVGYIQEIGISAERRSIYKDIEEINKALYIVENDVDVIDAEEAIIDDEEKAVVYDSSKKGFFVRQREGIEIAKSEGKYKGRKPVDIDEEKFVAVCKKWRDGKMTATAAMNELGLKPNTFYRRVKEMSL